MSDLVVSLLFEGQEDVSWMQWRELAATAERLGFDGLYRTDHYASEQAGSGRAALDAWGTICGLAAITTRLRLGTLVSPVTFRHPSVLAKLAVTADHISGGRIDVGLGAGWMQDEHVTYGFPLPSLGERMSILAEQAEIIHRTWTEAGFSFAGEHYRLEGLEAFPRPVTTPHPPLILGGDGGPRSLAIAADWADEYNSAPATDEELTELLGRMAAACERVRRDPSTLGLSMAIRVIAGRDRAEVEERAVEAARVENAPDQTAAGYLAVLPETSAVGSVDEVIERLRTLSDLGLSRVMLHSIDHTALDMIELIGTDVLPALTGG